MAKVFYQLGKYQQCTKSTEIKNKHATPRKTKLINTGSSGSVTETKREQRLAPVYQDDTCFITLSNSGLVRRIPESVYSSQGRGGKGRKLKIKEDDPIINSFFAFNFRYNLRKIVFPAKNILYFPS